MTMSSPVPAGSTSQAPPNINSFLNKKTITQGLLDIALLTSNVAQLKYVMSLGNTGANAHPYYYPMVVLIWLSIVLQVSVGLCLILLGKTSIDESGSSKAKAETLNNLITGQVFLITVINIIISSFNIEETIERSGKIHDWVTSWDEYRKSCECLDPIRAYYGNSTTNCS